MRILSLLLGVLCISCGTTKLSSNVKQVADQANIKQTLEYLASDELKGRDTGSKENQLAAAYLSTKLAAYGVKPLYSSYNDTLTDIKDTWNIVGVIEGSDPVLSKEYVVLGAHYDHIGIVKAIDGDSIANGANDNAAGTSILLEIARNLSLVKDNKRSVIIAFFTAEEIGIFGSKHLAKRLRKEDINVVSMLNFEMLGLAMNRDYMTYLTGYDMSTLAEKLNEYAGEAIVGKLEKAEEYKLFMRSDNYPFYQEFNVPCQSFSSFDFENYEYYHHVKDEAHLMDYDFMTSFATKVIPVIRKVVNSQEGEIRMK